MDNTLCFCSVAFGDRYVIQQRRLKESILKIYPDVKLFFWENTLPPGSKWMSESLYGFKVHAIQFAKDAGYRNVIWVDTAMILMSDLNRLFEYNFVAVMDDNLLVNCISEKALEYYQITKEFIQSMNLHLVGGSLYYFDFKWDFVNEIFEHWKKAEEAGVFGTQQEEASGQLQGHRWDEACMAVAMIYRAYPIKGEYIGYNTPVDPLFIKKHFK